MSRTPLVARLPRQTLLECNVLTSRRRPTGRGLNGTGTRTKTVAHCGRPPRTYGRSCFYQRQGRHGPCGGYRWGVGVSDVVRENLSSVVSSNGKVEPVMPISFRVGFPTFVTRVYAVEGQQVKRGQLLFALDDTGVRAELAQSRADLALQVEALNVAKSGGRADQIAKVAADLQKAQATREQLRRENDSLTKLVGQKAATQ